jgi:hypothetical protein
MQYQSERITSKSIHIDVSTQQYFTGIYYYLNKPAAASKASGLPTSKTMPPV